MSFHNHVIDIDFNISTDYICKHFVHQTLLCCSDVLKAEWHLLVAQGVTMGMKSSFLFIFSSRLNLMIALFRHRGNA